MTAVDQMLEQFAELVATKLAEKLAGAKNTGAELVTIATYAAHRKISQSTVRQAIRDGRLTATRCGRAVRLAADAEISQAAKPNQDKLAARSAKLRLIGGGK